MITIMNSQNGKIKGFFFQFLHSMLSEYNPDIYKEISKKLSFDINALEANKWYPFTNILEYLTKLSKEARVAITKRLILSIKEKVPLFNDCKLLLN